MKAHVEHLVGLIQHDILATAEFQIALFQVINEAAWRTHHHFHAAAQIACLTAKLNAAIDARGTQTLANVDEVTCHLQRQLARGQHNNETRFARCRIACVQQLLDQGQRKGQRLACAGARFGYHIAAAVDVREGRHLNLEQRRDSLGAKRSQHRWGQWIVFQLRAP